MAINSTQLSLIEAIKYLRSNDIVATNKDILNYYTKMEGIGQNFFNLFAKIGSNPGASINRKTISKSIRKLSLDGYVKIDKSYVGQKRIDVYHLTDKGSRELRRQVTLYRLKKNLELSFDAAQAEHKSKVWVVLN